jgi:type II secretory pathway pseudopilin PulG
MKGQVSTELLIIIGIVLLIFVPLLVMVYFKTNEANTQIGSYQTELAVFRLAYLANSVGSLGTNSSITTDVYIPPGVTNISTRKIGNGGEVLFKVQTPAGESEVVEIVKYPIANPQTFITSQGWARFTISSNYENGQATLTIDSTRGQ